jgi:murein DD-endopeptidase MepM/ murein hydrolase activator NlpD
LLAVADGIVIESKDDNTLTGIAVTNLFEWNSILIQICSSEQPQQDDKNQNVNINKVPNLHHPDGDLFVEYVHISKSFVSSGDRVTKGQVIGYSGSVGFSPEPHLHFSAFRSSHPESPTVRVLFEGPDGTPFLPRSGDRYNETGRIVK